MARGLLISGWNLHGISAEIPVPFEKGSSLWTALRQHLHLAPTKPTSHKAGQ